MDSLPWGGNANGMANIHPTDHIVAWELFGRTGIRQGSWKAVFIPKPWGPARWQLSDLDQDPGETKDLVHLHGEKMDELLGAYREYVLEMYWRWASKMGSLSMAYS